MHGYNYRVGMSQVAMVDNWEYTEASGNMVEDLQPSL